jgi:nitrogen fixation/metabolism regulation signal transduction histidine kinase
LEGDTPSAGRRGGVRIRGESQPTSIGLLILVLFYILLTSLILVFARQIISHVSNAGSFANMAALIGITMVLPLVLLGAIIINIVRLIRERTRKKAGARLKTKLILFFTFIAVLSLIPQALLSITFINSAIDSWFSTGIGEALEGGLGISIEYKLNKVQNLRDFSRSPLLPDLLSDTDQAWATVRNANPEISLLQIFSEDGEELLYRGPAEGRLTEAPELTAGFSGPLPQEVRGGVTILKYLTTVSLDSGDHYVVLGIIYPKKFDEYASQITASRSLFNQLFRYRDLFRTAIVIFYFIFSFPILLLSILVSFLLTEEITRPISNLEEATRRIAEGDYSFRILSRTRDELSALVGSFNRMIGELAASRRKLVKAEKISAWKEIAQRLAHEIKNPLTPIKLSAQRILMKTSGSEESLNKVVIPSVSAIINEVENLNKLLVEFREFTRLPDPKPEPVDMKALVEEVISMYENLSQRVSYDCRFLSENTHINVDRHQMKQAFANLFKNAIQAMPEGGEIFVVMDIVKKDYGRYFRIQVRDTGVGMDEEARNKAFEPYFTTKKDGSGLGLPIVERIIFDHNGDIWFETREGDGTTFFIDLPLENSVA